MSKLPIPTGHSEIFRRMQPNGDTNKPNPPQPLTKIPATKAQRVKAWRKANPEAYAEQKRRSVEKRAADKLRKEQEK